MNEHWKDEASLVEDCISHLETEFHTMVDLNVTLKGIGVALRNHNLADLRLLVAEKEQQIRSVHRVRERRQILRERILLAMPSEENVTIAKWAESLNDIPRQAILDLRGRLLSVARQLRQQAQLNQVVVARGVRLLNQAIDCLSGQSGGSERYSSVGNLVGGPTLRSPSVYRRAE